MQPDYELADILELTRPEQLKALGDAFRQKILALLVEHASTTQELAEQLKAPTSTVAHHLQVLAEAGLIRVVQTRQVRALTQKYFGCTARSYVSISQVENEASHAVTEILSQAVKNIALQPNNTRFLSTSLGYARISRVQAETFARHLQQLTEEFENLNTPGEDTYGFFGTIYHMNLSE